MKSNTCMLTFLFLFAGYCITDAQKIKSLKNTSWLAGCWEAEEKKGNIYEEWKLINEQKMEGRSYRLIKEDTIFLETLQLEMEGSEFYYIATVNDQNEGAPVCFKMTEGNAMHLVFENLEHDYPQYIRYQWKQNNRFNAEIGGMVKGKMKSQLYIYKKVR